MHDHNRSRAARYAAVTILCVVVVALLFPIVDGLSVAGFLGDKTYLLILQDNAEIRPTGGLMNVLGVITLHNGQIANLQYYYGNSQAPNESSPPLRRLVQLDGPESYTKFFHTNVSTLTDSNEQYDFASFAPKMQSDFYNVTGYRVDGIIAIDLTAIKAVMDVTGPITVSGEVITSRNVADRLHYDSGTNVGRVKTSLTNLLKTLTLDIAGSIINANVPQKLALWTTLQRLESEKHVQIYPDTGLFLHTPSGERSAPTADSISVVDATQGTGKADFGVNRSIDYHVTLLPDGAAVSNLTLTYTNNCWWDYDVFTTTLVPPGAVLIGSHHTTGGFEVSDSPLVTRGDGFTAFSWDNYAAANTQAQLTCLYKTPNRVDTRGPGYQYDLFVHKQAGINQYILSTSVRLPPGTRPIDAENVGANQTLTGDVHAHVGYT